MLFFPPPHLVMKNWTMPNQVHQLSPSVFCLFPRNQPHLIYHSLDGLARCKLLTGPFSTKICFPPKQEEEWWFKVLFFLFSGDHYLDLKDKPPIFPKPQALQVLRIKRQDIVQDHYLPRIHIPTRYANHDQLFSSLISD